jgi:restriction endonuclease S subunit
MLGPSLDAGGEAVAPIEPHVDSGRGLASIRELNEKTECKWLYYQLLRMQNTICNIASGGGSTFPNINGDIIRRIILPYPKFNEQQGEAFWRPLLLEI